MASSNPADRSMIARMAALTLHSRVDSTVHTEPARAAGPGRMAYWYKQVDPDNELSESERERRAEAAKKAHFLRLALKSAKARAKK